MEAHPVRSILFYDFECDRLPLFSEPSSDPRQPHIVQLAAVLVDAETRNTLLSSINLIAYPDGWEIPGESAAIHGITTEHARRVGVPEDFICAALIHLWDRKDGGPKSLRVGHNEQFDARIQRIALKRFVGDAAADAWKAGEAECTARLAEPIMVAAGRGKQHKKPKLEEAFEHFIGYPMENAHDAMADVAATMAIYWRIKDRETSPQRGDTSFLDF